MGLISDLLESTEYELIGLGVGVGVGILIAYEIYFLPTCLMDGLAQGTELIVDCIFARDGTRLEICCGCNRKSIRRRKNCGCCDCSRSILFSVFPGVVGGMIDLAVLLGNWGENLGWIENMLLFEDYYPFHWGLVVLVSDLLQILINYPVAFCLAHRGVNSWRFITACGAAVAIRGVFQLDCYFRRTFAWMAFFVSQFVTYYAFSLILYAEHPWLNKKVIPLTNRYREHYDEEPDWDIPTQQPEDTDKESEAPNEWWRTSTGEAAAPEEGDADPRRGWWQTPYGAGEGPAPEPAAPEPAAAPAVASEGDAPRP